MTTGTGEGKNSIWLTIIIFMIGWLVYTFQVLIRPMIISALLAPAQGWA